MENYKNILVDKINTMYRFYKCIKYSKNNWFKKNNEEYIYSNFIKKFYNDGK